jgi:hypothetical protein
MTFASSLSNLTNSSGVSDGISFTPAFGGGSKNPIVHWWLSSDEYAAAKAKFM